MKTISEENKMFLDTNRQHLLSIKNGSLKSVNIPRFLKVMTEEFNPKYTAVDESCGFDVVAKLITDTYERYDAMQQK